jgi:hypothetical protein
MSYIYYNPNPLNLSVNDCTVRAISKAINMSWKETYLNLLIQGYMMCDVPSSNRVWGELLNRFGFKRRLLPDTCPNCYTIRDFCQDFPTGIYILGTGEHVVTIIDGDYYDSWDSGNEIPLYFFERKD